MKRGFILLLILSFLFFSFTSDRIVDIYNVIKVFGTIINKNSNKELLRGDILKSSDKLFFKTIDSKAAVINSIKGRFIISSPVSEDKPPTFIPSLTTISSRAGSLINLLDLENHFIRWLD